MPQFFFPDAEEQQARQQQQPQARSSRSQEPHRNMFSRWSFQKIGSWLKREEESPPGWDEKQGTKDSDGDNKEHGRPSGLLGRRPSRKVVPGLPRPLTFKRQQSEMRDNLLPVPVEPEHRRAASVDRKGSGGARKNLSPPPVSIPSMSAPEVRSPGPIGTKEKPIGGGEGSNIPPGSRQVDYSEDDSIGQLPPGEPPPPLSTAGDLEDPLHDSASALDEHLLQQELDAKWILNLSMHFRDMSDREKFFITYAEEPNKWRRVTVSCDYRTIEPESLESDLKSLHYQRDKSARIYEAIRDSLLDIQFYDTVTNLKLQTDDGRLHVHVTEDVNEIIPYPSVSAIKHLTCKTFRESSISFDSHISGFVYKVAVGGRTHIKKEIPGPDAVEEFLYEINALCSLQDSKSVIRFEGIIVDATGELIKGLLISYAEQGALVDIIYDWKHTDKLPWERRERWAKQIVEGLSEIHEAGFVQGDFTLSNIVIDHNDDAKIIDINRRGCPVGWEPPELAKLIESGQRISIYIGVKSDLFQLGMVLWALAEEQDEPERQERPLARYFSGTDEVPQYFRDLVEACLDESPRVRPAAKDILARFPEISAQHSRPVAPSRRSVSTHKSDKEYIDPATAIDLHDISEYRQRVSPVRRSSLSNTGISFEDGRPSTEYITSSGSYILPNAGHTRNRTRYHYGPRSIMSLDDSEVDNDPPSLPASRETRWEQVYVDGDTRLVQRGGLSNIDAHDFGAQEPATVCITTPPGELSMEGSLDGSGKTERTTPLQLSTVVELQPPALAPAPITATITDPHTDADADPLTDRDIRRSPHASFIDRVHMLNETHDVNPLAALENEISLDSSVTSAAPTRVGTGFSTFSERFSPPVHQDSGFNEPDSQLERFVNEAGRIREKLNHERIERELKEINGVLDRRADAKVDERLWELDAKEELQRDLGMFERDVEHTEAVVLTAKDGVDLQKEADGVGREQMEKVVEEKVSNNTIRPPSIVIPEFHHLVPQAIEVEKSVEEAKITEVDPIVPQLSQGEDDQQNKGNLQPVHIEPKASEREEGTKEKKSESETWGFDSIEPQTPPRSMAQSLEVSDFKIGS